MKRREKRIQVRGKWKKLSLNGAGAMKKVKIQKIKMMDLETLIKQIKLLKIQLQI